MYRWEIINELLKKKNNLNIAEIGVYEGKLTKKLLETLHIQQYWLVDPYIVYPNYVDTKAKQILLDKAYSNVQKDILDKYENTKLIKQFSDKASKNISANSLDLVFIDGNHDYEFVTQDIKLWYDKVKVGGILSGHDYNYPGIEGVKKAADQLFGEKVIVTDDYVWYIRKEV